MKRFWLTRLTACPWLLVLFLVPQLAAATQIVGGELDLQHRTGSNTAKA